jgi:hypothetical protein
MMTTHEMMDRPAQLRRRLQLLDREAAFMRAKDRLEFFHGLGLSS